MKLWLINFDWGILDMILLTSIAGSSLYCYCHYTNNLHLSLNHVSLENFLTKNSATTPHPGLDLFSSVRKKWETNCKILFLKQQQKNCKSVNLSNFQLIDYRMEPQTRVNDLFIEPGIRVTNHDNWMCEKFTVKN